jgi:NADPH-dependent curcumin reductase CurA
MKTNQIVLASRPKGMAQLSDFKFELAGIPTLQLEEELLKPVYFSVDPYMRGRMNEAKSYNHTFQLHKPIEGNALAMVVESKSGLFNPGDMVMGIIPWKELSIVSDKELQKIDAKKDNFSYQLSVLGMTGLTAYIGLIHICKPLAGETVVVSGAAGAVGLVVGQIAKIQGCRVVGITGSDEKVKLLVEKYGFDEAINYKTTSYMSNAIETICTDGVDIYFDNVGGDISDAVINNLNFQARIAICGQISLYNSTVTPVGPRLQPALLTKRAMMRGFLVNDFKSEFPDAIHYLTKWLDEDKLKFTETIFNGFSQLPAAFLGLFNGENVGKMIVKI